MMKKMMFTVALIATTGFAMATETTEKVTKELKKECTALDFCSDLGDAVFHTIENSKNPLLGTAEAMVIADAVEKACREAEQG